MKKYKVIALVCTGSGNNVFRTGEECREDQFPAGHADEKVKQGFLEVIESEEEKPETPEETPEEKLAREEAEALAAAGKGKKK